MAKGGQHHSNISNCGELTNEVAAECRTTSTPCLEMSHEIPITIMKCVSDLFQSHFRLVRMAEVWAKEVATVVTLSSSVKTFQQIVNKKSFLTKNKNNIPFYDQTCEQ